MFYLEVTNSFRLLKKICIDPHTEVIIHQPNVLFQSSQQKRRAMSATVALGRSMLLIRRVLLVRWVALAVGWAAAAVAGPAEDAVLFSKASDGHAAAVLELLDKGADVNARGDNGATALIAASGNGHLTVAQVLLAKGARSMRITTTA
jgi:hypothetical protein